MKFGMNPAPYLRSKISTLRIMLELTLALLVVWAAAIWYNFTISSDYGVKAILIVVVSLVSTLLIDILVALLRSKGKVELPKEPTFGNTLVAYLRYLLYYVVHGYSYVTALIFALIVPIGTPYYVVIIGAIFSTGVVKHVFGGFGSNIVNPAAGGRILVALSFGGALLPYIGETTIKGITTNGATVTTVIKNSFNWFAGAGMGKHLTTAFEQLPVANLGELLIGTHGGAIGETFTLLILALGVILAIRKVIDWRFPVFYLGTVLLCALVVGLANGVNVVEYMLIHLATGGLAFGAVFMLTDPVTTPTTKFGIVIASIIAGFLTFLIRVQGGYPEGVIFSIALVNILTPLIDQSIKGQTIARQGKRWGIIGGFVAASLLISLAIGFPIDRTAPTIEIDETVINIRLGTEFDLLEGVTATDEVDGDVVVTIKDDGGYDPNVEGEYTITYSAKDKAGNEATLTRVVKVLPADMPNHVINLSGAYYSDMLFTVTSDGGVGEDLTLEVAVDFKNKLITYVNVISSNEGDGEALLEKGNAFADKYIYFENPLTYAELEELTFENTKEDEPVNEEFDALVKVSPKTGKAVILAIKKAMNEPSELGYKAKDIAGHEFKLVSETATEKIVEVSLLNTFSHTMPYDEKGIVMNVTVNIVDETITNVEIIENHEVDEYGYNNGYDLLNGSFGGDKGFYDTYINISEPLKVSELNKIAVFQTAKEENKAPISELQSGATVTALSVVIGIRAAADYAIRGGK